MPNHASGGFPPNRMESNIFWRTFKTGLPPTFKSSAVIPYTLVVLLFLNYLRDILIPYKLMSGISSLYCRVNLALGSLGRSMTGSSVAVYNCDDNNLPSSVFNYVNWLCPADRTLANTFVPLFHSIASLTYIVLNWRRSFFYIFRLVCWAGRNWRLLLETAVILCLSFIGLRVPSENLLVLMIWWVFYSWDPTVWTVSTTWSLSLLVSLSLDTCLFDDMVMSISFLVLQSDLSPGLQLKFSPSPQTVLLFSKEGVHLVESFLLHEVDQ